MKVRTFCMAVKSQADSTQTSRIVLMVFIVQPPWTSAWFYGCFSHWCVSLCACCSLFNHDVIKMFLCLKRRASSWHNKKQFVANPEQRPADLHCANESSVTARSCGFLSASFGCGEGGQGGWRAFINSDSAPFESTQWVSSAVKAWILAMDDWPQGQCELCRPARWPQGGEAKRKWTWRSDQNIVWQGNKVKWSSLQFLWKVNQWGFCLNGSPAGYRVMVSL